MSPNLIQDITQERLRQDEKWGGPTHDDIHSHHDWADFIHERLDEIHRSDPNLPEIRQKFIQIVALGVAALEAIERKRNVSI